MRRRRWWLAFASVASLVILVYAGVFTAFSVEVTPDMEAANRLPGAASPAQGQRALVIPASDPTLISTTAKPRDEPGGAGGSLVLVGDPGASFPTNTQNPHLARALAYVTPTANGSYYPDALTLNLTFVRDGVAVHENVTLDVPSLAGRRAGFIVKSDAAPNATFVETPRVIGSIARFEPATTTATLLVVASLGFAAPLVALILTHRASGKGGVPASVTSGACPECRAATPQGASFCTRCGAWLDGGRAG